jgi:hypothetical protein
VLVEHRVDDVDERLVAGEQAVPPGEQVPLEEPLADVLGQQLDDPALAVQRLSSSATDACQRGGDLEDVLQPVAGQLVGGEGQEVVRVQTGHLAQPGAEHPVAS